MMKFLRGRKELATLISGFVVTLATTLGLTDWIGPLSKVNDAITAGDPVVILVAIFGLFMFAARYFKRLAENRANPVVAGDVKDATLPPATTATALHK